MLEELEPLSREANLYCDLKRVLVIVARIAVCRRENICGAYASVSVFYALAKC
jgi:hypothetical protein